MARTHRVNLLTNATIPATSIERSALITGNDRARVESASAPMLIDQVGLSGTRTRPATGPLPDFDPGDAERALHCPRRGLEPWRRWPAEPRPESAPSSETPGLA